MATSNGQRGIKNNIVSKFLCSLLFSERLQGKMSSCSGEQIKCNFLYFHERPACSLWSTNTESLDGINRELFFLSIPQQHGRENNRIGDMIWWEKMLFEKEMCFKEINTYEKGTRIMWQSVVQCVCLSPLCLKEHFQAGQRTTQRLAGVHTSTGMREIHCNCHCTFTAIFFTIQHTYRSYLENEITIHCKNLLPYITKTSQSYHVW